MYNHDELCYFWPAFQLLRVALLLVHHVSVSGAYARGRNVRSLVSLSFPFYLYAQAVDTGNLTEGPQLF